MSGHQLDNFNTSSLQLRHLQQHHSSLPINKQSEIRKIQQLQLDQTGGIGSTPFSIARDTTSTRKQADRFDNTVLRELISGFLINTNASLSVVENPRISRDLGFYLETFRVSRHLGTLRPKSRDISRHYAWARDISRQGPVLSRDVSCLGIQTTSLSLYFITAIILFPYSLPSRSQS